MAHDEAGTMRFWELLLRPLSILFGLAVWVRGRCYDAGVLPIVRVSVPVISVGNMTAGGTGKTPMVEYLVRALLSQGMRVAVVSRGYRRSGSGLVVVSDGTELAATAETAGDEPYQIARKFRNAIVIVDEKKSRAAAVAAKRFGASVVIVDDGFQHRALARDLDIVLVDSTKELRSMPFLPAGLRRDIMSALGRAQAVVFSRCGDDSHAHEAFPEAGTALLTCMRSRVTRAIGIRTEIEIPVGALKGAVVAWFCAIGDPLSFHATLKELGCVIKGATVYPDHHVYSPDELQEICERGAISRVSYILTTEKDAMRILTRPELRDLMPPNAAYVEIESVFVRGGEELLSLVRSTAGKAAA